uniref:protein-serine/threonine phosphatase n=1 Tax=Anopheles marajoara TaxID=58244 RepID=A0A2M4BED1_9DIPT
MGAYLSTPITEKESSDESNEFLVAGSSSMQGWRMSQEDAHNCILDFDENVSFFAVYDGHGGAEVAKYCSLHLPNFLRTVAAYGEKNFEQALKDAFIGFDATLLEGPVIQELRVLLEKTDPEEAYEEEEESDNVENLREEAIMPLYEVLQKYRKGGKPPATGVAATGSRQSGSSRGSSKMRLTEVMKEAGSCAKPISPLLKGKKAAVDEEDKDVDGEATAGGSGGDGDVAASSAEAAPAAKEAGMKPAEDAGGDAVIDSTVSSSSNNKAGIEGRDDGAAAHQEPSSSSSSSASAVRKEEQIDEISDTDGIIVDKSSTKDTCAPDSSSSDPSKQQPAPAATSKVNGDVGKGPSASSAAAVSSSSSANSAGQENGVASSDCGGSKKAESVHSSSSSSSGGSCGEAGSGSSKAASTAASPATVGGRRAKNGPAKPSLVVDDDDSDEDDESDSDEEFPPVAEPTDTSSTEDGDEEEADNYEECSEDEEDVEEEYEEEEEEDYMNEEDEAFMRNISDEPGKDSGCTAVVALLHGKDLYVANAGDSRCVVCRKGEALEMSFDHKPEDTIEFERIEKAGGRVTLDGRVNGGLNLSRAIGDHGYKMNKSLPPEEQMISALPDIQKITIGPEDEFMVLACDGIWNFMTSEEVVQFVKERIKKPNVVLSQICEELFDNCLAPHTKGDGTGCDNMTAIIVQFKPNFTGAASRKRAATFTLDATTNSDIPASGSKKIKTDTVVGETAASSSTDSGTSNGSAAVEPSDETEAVAAVASIEGTPMDTTASVAGSSEATSSSST